ncbi:MAG: hypothetical protein KME64_36655 [Scytonematopsis contorta HA4267-MV1]|jgi:hypothetical protein|nr:hypothetical protein [Scytonematopsis contorta HA4267-MV1]
MNEVLELIEKKKVEFAQLPLFKFLVDDTINPIERVSWAPCFAPFAMMFKDINAYALRREPADSAIQEMINRHSYEDGRHWRWYLEDIENLGLDEKLNYSDTLKFLWGEQTKKTRELSYTLFALCINETDLMVKLAIIESIESTGTVALRHFAKLGEQIQEVTQKKCRYFSGYHLKVETGHIQGGKTYEETDDFLRNIQLTEEQKFKAFSTVEIVFESFSESMNEMMAYVQKNSKENHQVMTHA